MADRYFSRFSGQIIDEAVEKALHLDKISDSYVIESTPDKKYNLDELVEKGDGSYRIKYYTNSANDASIVSPIDVHVKHISSTELDMQYEETPGVIYYRQYDTLNGLFTQWKQDKTLQIVDTDDVVGVRQQSIVIRQLKEGEKPKSNTFDGQQSIKVTVDPT